MAVAEDVHEADPADVTVRDEKVVAFGHAAGGVCDHESESQAAAPDVAGRDLEQQLPVSLPGFVFGAVELVEDGGGQANCSRHDRSPFIQSE